MLLLLALQAATPLVMRLPGTAPPCDAASGNEVVVCAERPDRHRLPLREERGERPVTAGPPSPSGMAALTPAGRCGIFAGERRCGKREAAEHGYGRGRDPVTLLQRLGTRLIDPDAELPDS